MLSKKCLFWKGMYLSCAIAIFPSVSSDVVAQGNLHDFRSELNQIYWRICCANREFVIKNYDPYKTNKWILDDYYEYSRSKVIGKAIGDCVAGKNEFANKKPEDIITFDNKQNFNKYIDPINYEQKHWNAVILYNYVHEAINGNLLSNDESQYRDAISNVRNLLTAKLRYISNYYEDYYTKYAKEYGKNPDGLVRSFAQKLIQAVTDVQKYVDTLWLNTNLYKFRTKKLEYNKFQNIKNIAPDLDESSNDVGLRFITVFDDPVLRQDKIHDYAKFYKPSFCYCNGEMCISELVIGTQYQPKGRGLIFWQGSWSKSFVTWEDFNKYGKWLISYLKGLIANVPDDKLLRLESKDEEDYGF